jgi:hypothetical protein
MPGGKAIRMCLISGQILEFLIIIILIIIQIDLPLASISNA